jgi:hypothetical protein
MPSFSHPDEKILAAELAGSGSELAWLSDHAAEVEREYRGEWLLVNGAHLLAHSSNIDDIQQRIADLHLQFPFVYFVPEHGDAIP